MYRGAAPNPDAPRVSFNPPIPLSKGAIRACGLSIATWLSLPASSGPASDDALLILRSVLHRLVVPLPQALTMCAAFASSTYLLSQIPGPACLNPPNPLFKGAHQAFVRTGAHGHRFAVLRQASEDALAAFRDVASSLCLALKKVYHCRIYDATRKMLTINSLGVFRVGVFTTLKTVKQLSLSDLQVAIRPSIK